MSASAIIRAYLKHPFPIWDEALTLSLVNDRWRTLAEDTQWTPRNYNTAGYLLYDFSISPMRTAIPSGIKNKKIYVESSSFDYIGDFYNKTALHPYLEEQLNISKITTSFQEALQLLEYVAPSSNCIHALVRSIVVLAPDNPDTDTSYSHPDIPFSIFVSYSEQPSDNSAIRLLESIFHEAMHLLLSLIEHHVPLVKSCGETELHYSPWRDEPRPTSGILHGLFVFRAIYELFSELTAHTKSTSLEDYMDKRLKDIANEIKFLANFSSTTALTAIGAMFAKQLTVI